MRDANLMYFDTGKDAADFILKLFEAEELGSSNYHNDIHCYRAMDNLWAVEWVQTLDCLEEDLASKFVLLEPQDSVMRQVNFPDGHYDYVEANDEAVRQAQDDWRKDHPDYKEGKATKGRTDYGDQENSKLQRRRIERFDHRRQIIGSGQKSLRRQGSRRLIGRLEAIAGRLGQGPRWDKAEISHARNGFCAGMRQIRRLSEGA